MTRATCRARAVAYGVALLTFCLSAPSDSAAQAWTPFKGQGSASVSYTYFKGGDHLFSGSVDGESSLGYVAEDDRWYLGDTFSHTVVTSLDYGLTYRLAVSASLSFVTTKYDGRAPVNREIDDGLYHRSLQDVTLHARHILLLRPVAVTPFISVGLPTRDYVNNGHAALGLGLREFRFGINLGRVLAPWVPRGYAHLAFGYGISEEVFDHRLRRSSFDLELGYQVGRFISVRALGAYLGTAGGQDWLDIDGSVHGDGPRSLGTAFSASSQIRTGAGISAALPGDLSVHATLLSTIWGENVEDGIYGIAGTTWQFTTPFDDF